MDSTVFVTQETEHDFSKAEEFGEVAFLTRADLNNIKGSLHNRELIESLKTRLKDYVPNRDWIVITGSPYVAATVFLLLGIRGFRKVQILRWDNRDFIYRPMVVEL